MAPLHACTFVAVVAVAGAAHAEPLKKSWLASEAPLVAPKVGVAVVALPATPTDATWPVALAIYGKPTLRPKITDRVGRVLAGESTLDADPEPVRDLAALRAKLDGDDAPSRAILAEIVRRTSTLALVVVSKPEGKDAIVRIYDGKDDRLEATQYLAEKSGPPWAPLLGTLDARYAPKPAPSKPEEAPKPVAPTPESKSFYKSPWFWGALGAAAAAGVTVFLLTRNNGDLAGNPHVEWATK